MEYLCDEILLKIFKYCEEEDRGAIRLINKRFNRLVCDLDKYRYPLKIRNYWLQDEISYRSIVNSQRIFDKMELDSYRIELDMFFKLRTVCHVRGTTITKFTWVSGNMTSIEIVGILNLLPNLKSLNCMHWKLESQYYDQSAELINVPLEELIIKSCNERTVEFFVQKLPENVLKSLSIEDYCPTLVERQMSLTHLIISALDLDHKWIAPPFLTHLELSIKKYKVDGERILNSIIKQQPELVSLNIIDCSGIFDDDNEAFIGICNLKNLKILKINVDDLSYVAFMEHFKKLSKIEELWIESIEHNYSSLVDIIEVMSKTKLENLSTLNIDVSYIGVPINRIEKMGINYPRLKKFQLCCENPLPLDIYMKSFKLLESIKIGYRYVQEFSLVCGNISDVFFNMKDIKLSGFNFGSDINSNETSYLLLIDALPNLISLEIDINIPLSMRFLPRLLQKLPKLRVLKGLNMVQKSALEKFGIEFVNYIIMLSKKLENLALEVKVNSINMDVMEMKKMLNEKFIFNMTNTGCNIMCIRLSKRL